MKRRNSKKAALAAALILGLCTMGNASAAENTNADSVVFDETIQEAAGNYPPLEETLAKMRENYERNDVKSKEAEKRVEIIGKKELSSKDRAEVDSLKSEFFELSRSQAEILNMLDRLADRIDSIDIQQQRARLAVPGPTTANLVNPAPAKSVNYTQDAINAQGNSTMTFAYSPNQLYKIYCRRGYVTDLAFKKGESITYIGGGDTAGWAVSQTTVDGAPHLYIKPVVETSTTNLIVATEKKLYHIILTSSNWYNPMIEWSYAEEDAQEAMTKRAAQNAVNVATVGVTDIENLDHAYTVKVKGADEEYKPVTVYSDGKRTYLEFAKLPKKQVPLFIQQKGERTMTIANYRAKGHLYIIDAIFDKAQLRVTETDSVTIQHKR